MVEMLPGIQSLVDELRHEGYSHALLMGMGGSSLAPEVYRFTFGTPDLLSLPDGSIILIYYATIEGVTGVRACRFLVHES